ncbi:MAG: 30S ribosomal protein S3 [Chloroflexi bacterium]|nr:30S ribosomal protein S3 [Chloroflexota bacterium]
MGQKVHPLGFRLGSYKTWLSRWHDDHHYAEFVHEDLGIRRAIQSTYQGAGISKVEIERGTGDVTVTIHTARPGIVIGRGGQRVDEVRGVLERLTKKKVHLNIREIRTPELDAYLVGRNIADQMERRISFRRAMKRAITQTMDAGAKGIKVDVSGRLGGQEIARRTSEHQGSVPLHTMRADIDYAIVEAHTPTGKIGVKVWIYLGDVVPDQHAHAEGTAAGQSAEGAPGSN